MLDRRTPPQIKKVEKIDFLQPEKRKLRNGVEVLGFNTGSQEVVQIELVFSAGSKFSSKEILAQFTSKMIGEASTKFKPGQIMDQIDFYGAFLESSSGKEITNVSLFTLVKQMDEVLPVFAEAILNAQFPEKELKTYLARGKQKFTIENEKVGFRCRNLFSEILFKGHPYSGLITENLYDEIEASDLVEFYRDNFQKGEFFIVVAGNYPDTLYDKLDTYFGNLGGTPPEYKLQELTSSKANAVYEEKEGAIQSGIRIGKIIDVEFGSDDYFKLKVLNTVLGGYFGSRLMSNIREDKGYTYGIGSSVSSLKEAIFFVISTEVGAEVTNQALEEIYKEIRQLRNELILENELEMVKNYMLGSLLKGSDGPFLMAEKFKSVYLRNSDLSYYDRYIHLINSVNAVELKEIANKYLMENSFLEVVVGQKK